MDKKVKNVLQDFIESMKKNGFECESPYDLENFMYDYGSHSKMIDAGLFPNLNEE